MFPSKQVIASFGVRGNTRRLTGGQGTTYLVGKTVFKQVENEVVTRWVIDTLAQIEQRGFRIPRFLVSTSGEFLVDGWVAYDFLPGTHVKGRWIEKRGVLDAFHRSLKNVSYPPFLEARMDPWARADKMAWGEMIIECHSWLQPFVNKLTAEIKPLQPLNQVIQGDPGNIIFTEDEAPAIIDFSPYWRPADFSLAVLIVDALVWEDATNSILEYFRDVRQLNQLLVRAELRRILELDGLHRIYGRDCLDEIDKHKPTVELICSMAAAAP